MTNTSKPKNTNAKFRVFSLTKFFFPGMLIVSLLLFYSCGGGNKPSSQAASQDTSTAYVPSQPSAYDPNKIDPSAPVMEFTLNAMGNSIDVMSFSMPEIHVKSGTTVKIHFMNMAKDSALKHNFFIVKNGTMEQVATAGNAAGADKGFVPDDVSNIFYHSKVIEPGESVDLVFAAPPTGAYQYVCTYPGHWQKMNGKFIVE